MKKSLFILLCLAFYFKTAAQTPACLPDQRFKDSMVGLYPLPFDSLVSPNGGINKSACIGKPYQFVFTVKVPETFLYSGFNIPLDSITIAKTGAVENLPVGITYACNPPNCVFKKNSLGCAVLTGTADASNLVRNYELFITGRVFSFLLASAGLEYYEVKFPGPLFIGKYTLPLLAANNAKCTSAAANDLSADVSEMRISPNPTPGSTMVFIEAKTAGSYKFKLCDVLGKTVLSYPLSIQAGFNQIDIATDALPAGAYIYVLEKGNRIRSGKLIVNR